MKESDTQINLLELLASFVRFLRLRKNLIIICCIIGLAFGTIKGRSAYIKCKDLYVEKLIVSSTTYSNYILTSVINSIEKGDSKKIAKELNIPLSVAKNIIKIEAKLTLVEGTIAKSENESIVDLEIHFFKEATIKNIEKGLYFYLSHNSYIKESVEAYLEKREALVEVIEGKMNDLSAKTKVAINAEGTPYEVESRNIEMAYVSLFEQKQKLEAEIKNADVLKIISSQQLYENKGGNKFVFYTLLFGFLGFLMALAIGWFQNMFKSVKLMLDKTQK